MVIKNTHNGCEEVEEIVRTTWDISEFCWQVNLPFQIQQVRIPIWQVSTLITSILYPMRECILLVPHIPWYCPEHLHLHRPSLYLIGDTSIITLCKVNLSLSVFPCHGSQLFLSTAYTEYRIRSSVTLFLSLSWLQVDHWMSIHFLAFITAWSTATHQLSNRAQW